VRRVKISTAEVVNLFYDFHYKGEIFSDIMYYDLTRTVYCYKVPKVYSELMTISYQMPLEMVLYVGAH